MSGDKASKGSTPGSSEALFDDAATGGPGASSTQGDLLGDLPVETPNQQSGMTLGADGIQPPTQQPAQQQTQWPTELGAVSVERQQSHLPSGLRAGGSVASEEAGQKSRSRLQILAKKLIGGLYMLVRNLKLYDPDNAIFLKPIEELVDVINTLLAMEGGFRIHGVDETVFLNDVQIRVDFSALDNVRKLLKELEDNGLGGFEVDRPVTGEDLKQFLRIFTARDAESTAAEIEGSGMALKPTRLTRVKELLSDADRQTKLASMMDAAKVDRKRYAVLVYGRLVQYVRGLVGHCRGRGASPPLKRASRAMQEMIEILGGGKVQFLGFSAVSDEDEYLAYHSANTALLAVYLGTHLGLSRRQLLQLGMSGLLHDIGRVDLPISLLERRDPLSPTERKKLKVSPLLSARRLLRLHGLTGPSTEWVIAAYEHKFDLARPGAQPPTEVPATIEPSPVHPYSRIVAICDVFDALCSRRQYRAQLTPTNALASMRGTLSHKFDQYLLWKFCELMENTMSRGIRAPDEAGTN